MDFENRNYALAGAFIDELARCGLEHVCICPGSRSSPLAIAFARHPGIRTWVHLDERSASFFALGMARATGKPVAVVCSSGTASANFLPAVVEARYGSVPLLALTADRPPEMVDWGTLQTIDQTRMYGSHAKWSVNMPPPEATTEMMSYARSVACRAYFSAGSAPAGPVHVDFPFREPLEPVAVPSDFPESIPEQEMEAWRGREDGKPFVFSPDPERKPRPEDIQQLAASLAGTERGLIVCGPQSGSMPAEVVTELAWKLGYPILADTLSGLRCGPHDRSLVIDSYDAFIRDSELVDSLAPELVIRLGALPVSKPLTQYLEKHKQARHILVDESNDWRDPFRLTSQLFQVSPALFCESLSPALHIGRSEGEWSRRWRRIAGASRDALDYTLEECGEMFEGKVFSRLAALLPDDTVLFAGNSMPIRDMDTFFLSTRRSIQFMANRGASGIDGVVSSALGVAAVSQKRVVLVLGDISLYHDMNGLLAAGAHGLNATIIVLNNNGGGIFSFLPQADYQDVFETYFGTPHGLTFGAAAEMYGLDYSLADDWDTFDRSVLESLSGNGVALIEAPGDRERNVALHRQVWEAVSEEIKARSGR